MVNTSKILTVSYGTFSCTLEGFDDSFDTMKAIAEYFRDLAADDRYFGAEPPTPDAEMLARIAQRESSRQVAAHSDEGRIVLRAQRDDSVAQQPAEDAEIADEPVAAAPQPAPTQASAMPEPAPQPTVAPVAQAAPVAAPQALVEPAPAEFIAPQIQAEPDSVAAKLQRIRAVVSRNDTPQPMAVDFDEDEHADDLLVRTRQDLDAALAADDVADETASHHEEVDAQDPVETAQTEDHDQQLADPAIAAEDVPADELAEIAAADDIQGDEDELDSIADEAVVAQPVAQAPVDDYYEDEEDADATEIELSSLTVEVSEEIEIVVSSDAQEDDDQESAEDAQNTSILARLAAAQKAVTSRLTPSLEEHEAADDTAASDEAVTDADDEDDDSENFFEDQDAAQQDESPAPLRARIIKLKRSEFEAAVAQGDIEDNADNEDRLSDEDEDDLMEELSRVEAELTDDFDPETSGIFEDDFLEDGADEDDDEDEALAAVEETDADEDDSDVPASVGRAQFASNDAEEDVSRLIEKANTELDEPEANRRRSAIAHLRAAVAATKAEKSAGGELSSTSGSAEAYRDDLDNAVRPRRPTIVEATRSIRPGEGRPAPLKLVAEQRIDINERSDDPIRPRRISLAEDSTETFNDGTVDVGESDSFTEFAESVGATDLGELLEAAAAYLSFVEGREQFSRPQLMTKVRQVEKEEFSREDGLRLFGKLLREGKIQKLKGGRFTASDRISYKPDARYAGE